MNPFLLRVCEFIIVVVNNLNVIIKYETSHWLNIELSVPTEQAGDLSVQEAGDRASGELHPHGHSYTQDQLAFARV